MATDRFADLASLQLTREVAHRDEDVMGELNGLRLDGGKSSPPALNFFSAGLAHPAVAGRGCTEGNGGSVEVDEGATTSWVVVLVLVLVIGSSVTSKPNGAFNVDVVGPPPRRQG